MKKKILSILIVVVVALSVVLAFTACQPKDVGENIEVKFIVPDGAPALAIAKFLKDKPSYDGYEITYEIVQGTEIAGKMASGEATLAIVPTNMASILNNNKGVKLISVNTHGLLYLVGKEPASSLEDLKGNVVYNIGRGGTPDITFKYILTENNIEYAESDTPISGKVALHYVASGAELIPMLKQGTAKYGILGEPAVNQAIEKAGVQELFNIQAEWAKVFEDEIGYPQASFVGQKDFLTEENKAFVDWILAGMEENADWILDNPSLVGEVLANNGSMLLNNYTREVLVRTNIRVVRAKDAKHTVLEYLSVLHAFAPQTVGGAVPQAESLFYMP